MCGSWNSLGTERERSTVLTDEYHPGGFVEGGPVEVNISPGEEFYTAEQVQAFEDSLVNFPELLENLCCCCDSPDPHETCCCPDCHEGGSCTDED